MLRLLFLKLVHLSCIICSIYSIKIFQAVVVDEGMNKSKNSIKYCWQISINSGLKNWYRYTNWVMEGLEGLDSEGGGGAEECFRRLGI
jgi:hypothetical protein